MEQITLSQGLEDYLECIYNHIDSFGSVKAIEISKDLNVSRASVTDALHRLAEKKYINYERYGSIILTDNGVEKAKEIINKHNILKKFFQHILNLSEMEASENACRIEHVITKNAFNKLREYTEVYIKEHGN